jgi:aminoglycoside/choline kinase family phosphotransferase
MAIQPSQDTINFVAHAINTDKFEITPLAGDASNRRYYRIIKDDRSWVLMSWEPFKDDGNYPFLSVLRHFAKNGVQVPNVVALAPDLGQVLLEDLGDLTLERKFWENHDQREVLPFYCQAIDEIVKIHYRASADKSDCTAFKIEFNTERLLWEMNYGREHLLEKLCGLNFSDKVSKQLQETFTDVCATLDQQPKHICHRDYHSRNLMLKLGKMRVIDFQDARLGPIEYDLVSLLKDSYVTMEPAVADELIDYYFEEAEKLGAKLPSRQHFEEIYGIQSIQRCFKACGSFSSFYNLREDTRYLKYLPRTLALVKDALQSFPKHKVLLQVLEDNGILERKFEIQSS